MQEIVKGCRLNLGRAAPGLVSMLLCCLILSLTQQAMARKGTKTAQELRAQGAQSRSDGIRSAQDEAYLREQKLRIEGHEPDAFSCMKVTFDWTSCHIHRMDHSGPMEIFLNGVIEANGSEMLTFSAVQADAGVMPKLYFVRDEPRDDPQTEPQDITLEWAIALNDGPFEQMTILPDNRITYSFPAGQHSFRVRISGSLSEHQASGYYRLQLSQTFIPLL